jgi:hypothetical protein
VKNGTTYIAMKNPNSAQAEKYKEVFEKYWTISPVKFIKYSEIAKNVSPKSSFFTIGGYETTTQNVHMYSNGTSRNGINYSITHLYLELWTVKDKFFESKKGKEFKNSDQVQIARIELFTDFPTLMKPENIYLANADGDNHIRNWGPGLIKNYVQLLMASLNEGKEKSLFKANYDPKQLNELRNKKLFVPDYVHIKFNKFTGDESKIHDEKEIFEDYGYKYELVSTKVLNEKILESSTAFYYLVYVKSSTDKYVSVINSATGEIVYTVYSPVSYNFKSGDLKDIFKKINN